MAKEKKPFKVDTRPSKDVVVDGLTRDATVEACIFDLIDNSIDAARETATGSLKPGEDPSLNNYAGFEITLEFSGVHFRIIDNCGGIPVSRLKSMVLRFGKRSAHESGIGVFGVGLNRALFKLGQVSHFKTDTGVERAELILDVKKYVENDDWNLPAQEFPSSGKPGTDIEITQVPAEISKQFADAGWVAEIQREISERYSRFLDRGLTIHVGDEEVTPSSVRIRENGPFDPVRKFFKAAPEVSVLIEYGQHEDHRFTNEGDYDKERNAALTPEFGWTILCNDRAILVSDRTYKTGWEKFHTEFYGFAGVVNFSSADPAKLPWNTSKSDVDLNNAAYQAALDDMKTAAKKWREWAELRKKKSAKGEKLPSIPPAPTPRGGEPRRNPTQIGPKPPPPRAPDPIPAPRRPPTIKEQDPENRFLLPRDVDERHCSDKLLSLVQEAKSLDLGYYKYSGLALLRMLFESTACQFAIRHNLADQLKQHCVATRRSKGMKVPPDEEKNLTPSMDEIISFLQADTSVLGAIKGSLLRHSLNAMKSNQGLLNGVLHSPYQPIGRAAALKVRDDLLPIVRHLIET